jgi:hypothetical protein
MKREKIYHRYSFSSIAESMIPFKMSSSPKKFMPLNHIKCGYLVWCFADALTGFIVKFGIQVCKGNYENGRYNTIMMYKCVILEFCDVIKYGRNLIAFDKFSTTYNLMKQHFFLGLNM